MAPSAREASGSGSLWEGAVSRRLTEGESVGLPPALQPKAASLGFAVPSDQTASKNRGSLLPSPVHALVTPPSQREACSEGGWGKHGG